MKRLFVNFMTFAAMATALTFTACSSDSDGDDNGNGNGGNGGGTGSSIVVGENILSGTLTGEQTLDAKEYILNGTVIIADGGRLNIPAGTTIKAREGFSSYLLVAQGGKLYADGTADKPIVFTANTTSPVSGYWGGVIINGKAPISGSKTDKSDTALTEINNDYKYGGSAADDNSGSLTYVKICYAGARSTADIEHNGLTLNGVGNGTKIENIYVLESADDAIEFFGGTVNVTNLLAVNPDDDMFDFTQGYCGTLKNCYGVWESDYTSTEADPRGIEADGNMDGLYPDHLRQSDFKVENMTIVNNAANTADNVDRMQDKEKTGVFTGSYAINPLNGAKVPIWLSDYVLADYGTGAIMCVPAHDDRDFEFATKFNIPIIQVIAKDGKEIENMTEAYTEASGTMINSGEWNGMESAVLKKEAPAMIEARGIGKKTVNYKLRDWVFSRQRYWGEPIPIVHCPKCGNVPVPEDQLPLKLPEVESYQPTGTGESPLAAIDSWVNTTCPCCGAPAKRETNTMPQWAGSSWYFLRYVDNKNDKELVSKEKADKYLPVDMYIGGVEHAVLHLLYSRFYTKFLYDIGVVDFDEPFKKLFNQGMITGKNGIKMSKSKGNVVSPDDLVRDYGCDALRMYELFVGPPELDAEWDDRGIEGVARFLNRFYNLVMDSKDKDIKETKEMVKLRHKLVYDIETRFNQFSLNTVVSGFMEYCNKLTDVAKKEGGIDKETLKTFVILLAPFTPHLGEELWRELGGTDSVFHATWPECDEEAMKDDEIEVAVQVNGKVKAVIMVPADIAKEDAIAAGKAAVEGKITGNIVKEIYVPKKIVNLVVK